MPMLAFCLVPTIKLSVQYGLSAGMHQAGPVGTPLAGCSTPRASRPVASRRMPAAQGFKANCTSGARWALCLEKRRHSLNSGVRANAAIRFKHRSLSRPSSATRGFYPPVSKDTVNAGDKTYQDCLTSCSAAAVFGYRRHRRWAKVTNTVPGLTLAVGARSSQSRPQASQAPAPPLHSLGPRNARPRLPGGPWCGPLRQTAIIINVRGKPRCGSCTLRSHTLGSRTLVTTAPNQGLLVSNRVAARNLGKAGLSAAPIPAPRWPVMTDRMQAAPFHILLYRKADRTTTGFRPALKRELGDVSPSMPH